MYGWIVYSNVSMTIDTRMAGPGLIHASAIPILARVHSIAVGISLVKANACVILNRRADELAIEGNDPTRQPR